MARRNSCSSLFAQSRRHASKYPIASRAVDVIVEGEQIAIETYEFVPWNGVDGRMASSMIGNMTNREVFSATRPTVAFDAQKWVPPKDTNVRWRYHLMIARIYSDELWSVHSPPWQNSRNISSERESINSTERTTDRGLFYVQAVAQRKEILHFLLWEAVICSSDSL